MEYLCGYRLGIFLFYIHAMRSFSSIIYFFISTRHMAHRDEFLGQNINVSAMITVVCGALFFAIEHKLANYKLFFFLFSLFPTDDPSTGAQRPS